LAGKIKTKEEAVSEIKKISTGKKYKNNANIISVGSRGKRNKKWKK
jgi:hypothetical protein